MNLAKKYDNLKTALHKNGSVLIAYSGGVDSTFLLKAALDSRLEQLAAVTISAPYMARREIKEAAVICAEMGVTHHIIEIGIPRELAGNPENRCYLCKKIIFKKILKKAGAEGYAAVCDGTNADDINDFRPGKKALAELKIKSPLRENDISKNDIRKLSRTFNLGTADKPAQTCLLTRLPHGSPLLEKTFRKIEKAELFMVSLGFKNVRVRCHGELARIEVERGLCPRLFKKKVWEKIVGELKNIGFRYVTVDLEGYRTGSLNPDSAVKEKGIFT